MLVTVGMVGRDGRGKMVSACGDLGEKWSGQAVGDKADGGKQMHDHGQEVERSAIDNDGAP
jgi:hypothetical protein